MKQPLSLEYRYLILVTILISMWILFSLTTKEEFYYQCKIPKWMNIFFWYKAKNGTVPLLSLIIAIELYATVPIILTLKYFNPKLDLIALSGYYLFLPCSMVIMPSIMVLDGVANYKKKKRIKAEEEARVKRKKDNWIANNVKKKKKK